MSSDQGVFIIHRIPGRVRFEVGALRGDPERAERVAGLASRCPSVHGARANPRAGCLTVEHDPAVPIERLLPDLGRIPELSCCGARPLHELERPRAPVAPPVAPPVGPPPGPPSPERSAQRVILAAARVNAATRRVTHPHLDLKLIVPGALVGLGFYRALAGAGGTHWITFIKYGFDTFAVLNQELLRRFLSVPTPPAPAQGLAGEADPRPAVTAPTPATAATTTR